MELRNAQYFTTIRPNITTKNESVVISEDPEFNFYYLIGTTDFMTTQITLKRTKVTPTFF